MSEKFSEFLQAFRLKVGQSQEEFASRLRVPRSSVSGWEAGSFFPRKQNRNRLSKALGVSREVLDMMISKQKSPAAFDDFEREDSDSPTLRVQIIISLDHGATVLIERLIVAIQGLKIA